LSGCLASETAQLTLNGQHDRAAETVATYRDIFGAGNFYLELQDHGLAEQRQILRPLVELSKVTGVPLVATNDIHYTERDDAKPHDVLLCIQQQKVQTDMRRLRFETEEFYLKSAEEMRRVFSELPEACDATLEIAEACDLTLVYGDAAAPEDRLHLPVFQPPEGMARDAYLRTLVLEGADERYGTLTPEIRSRIDHELDVICSMGFAGYFLIVWDLIRFARERGIRVGPGRGRGAGPRVPGVGRGPALQDVPPGRPRPREDDRGGAEGIAGAPLRLRQRARGEGDRRHCPRAGGPPARGLRPRRGRRDRRRSAR